MSYDPNPKRKRFLKNRSINRGKVLLLQDSFGFPKERRTENLTELKPPIVRSNNNDLIDIKHFIEGSLPRLKSYLEKKEII